MVNHLDAIKRPTLPESIHTIINRFFKVVHKIQDLNMILVLFIEIILIDA